LAGIAALSVGGFWSADDFCCIAVCAVLAALEDAFCDELECCAFALWLDAAWSETSGRLPSAVRDLRPLVAVRGARGCIASLFVDAADLAASFFAICAALLAGGCELGGCELAVCDVAGCEFPDCCWFAAAVALFGGVELDAGDALAGCCFCG
jgi:hypothetical protein